MADLRARCRDAGRRVSGRTAELVRSLRNAPVVLLMPANQDAGSRPPATSHAHRNALVVDPQRAWIIATRWACALAACAWWISTPVATRVVGTLWGLPGLVSLVRFGTDDQKASAARALRDLAWRPDNSEAIAKAGGIPPLVNLLGHMKQMHVILDGTDDQLLAAADALRVLARRYDNSRLIHEANGFFPLVALVRDGNDEQKASAARALGHLLRSACGRAMANLEYKYCYPCHAEAQFVERAEHDHEGPWYDWWFDYWGHREEYAEVTQMVSEAEDTGVKRDRAFPPEWDFRVFMVRHIGEAGGIPPLVALVRDMGTTSRIVSPPARWRLSLRMPTTVLPSHRPVVASLRSWHSYAMGTTSRNVSPPARWGISHIVPPTKLPSQRQKEKPEFNFLCETCNWKIT